MRWAGSSPTCPVCSAAASIRGRRSRSCGAPCRPGRPATRSRHPEWFVAPSGCWIAVSGTARRTSSGLSSNRGRADWSPRGGRLSRGVPPVVNDPVSVELQRIALAAALGANAVTGTDQSMGGEDFAWYLDHAPGALARLGVHTPGAHRVDLHQSAFDIDERALAIGVRFMTHLAVTALQHPRR